MPTIQDFETELANKYADFLSAKEKEMLNPDHTGYQWKRQKLESLYQDTVLKSKYPKERLQRIEDAVQKEHDDGVNQSEQFKQAYKQNVLEKLQPTKEETHYKDAYKQHVLDALDKQPDEKEASSEDVQKRNQEMAAFEEKHGYEKVYELKREVLDDIKEMDLTPVKKEKLSQIEKDLENEKEMKLGKKQNKAHEQEMDM
ncbi:hypothetical protein [Lentibacillus amyloliquefaciens]|uniref:Uncharacterized protein n=1 Tax=Lentibacillus amyloliquefaciens TaxID=1472767 RepID=A0A0U4FNY5_9BACI|nr:hypothetical protein [Lentibacillus amyloliquefaciens]ALX47541.1 hypothetical protein AOX59_02330 [Lentibacillus amyloliquefaciens]